MPPPPAALNPGRGAPHGLSPGVSAVDTVRYWVAVAIWVSLPPAIVYWHVLHPFVGLWRRLGKPLTFSLLAALYLGFAYLLWRVRGRALATEYGSEPLLWIPAALSYGTAAWIQTRIRKQLPFRVLSGAPELEADGHGGRLLETGLYARVRHPRYVAVILGVLGMALFANYLAAYAMVLLTVIGLLAVIRLEERELAARFGEPYDRYRARVPALLPRLGRDPKG